MPLFNEKQNEALLAIIKEEIKQQGPLSFARFMSLSLYHESLGYYCSDAFRIGKQGDFTTAPELSPLFARCLAKQCLQLLPDIENAVILELGAGSGRMAGDLLTTLDKANCLPSHYYIYEISPALRHQQRTFLEANFPQFLTRVSWLDSLDRAKPLNGVIIANEVLDALPFHCIRFGNNRIQERCVDWNNDQLVWTLTSAKGDLEKAASHLQETYALSDGYESEINLQYASLIQSLNNVLNKGVILFSDYGYGQREYYHPERNRGTLTCFYQHQHHDNPLLMPGQQDMTAHVDFTRIIEAASEAGMSLLGYTTQAAFLLSCGLLDMAAEEESSLDEVDRFKVHQAIKVLTMPTEMGERIKIMGLGKNVDLGGLVGFRLQDRRREL
jgi:SAM-dependent MidA family methyltransferase